jgi:hypothetical protein
MLSREIKLLAQLVGASAGFSWTKESAGAIHDTLMLMAANAERLEAAPEQAPPELQVPTTATTLELAQAIARGGGIGVTRQQVLCLITLAAEKKVHA